MKKTILFIFLISVFFLFPKEILAAKVRLSRGSGTTTVKRSSSGGSNRVGYALSFKSGKTGINLFLSNLNSANSVTYELTYQSNGISQGVIGTVTPSDSSNERRDLLFGTCSGNVCRYHSNITNAKLVITSKLKSGITTRKTYRIRV